MAFKDVWYVKLFIVIKEYLCNLPRIPEPKMKYKNPLSLDGMKSYKEIK